MFQVCMLLLRGAENVKESLPRNIFLQDLEETFCIIVLFYLDCLSTKEERICACSNGDWVFPCSSLLLWSSMFSSFLATCNPFKCNVVL